MTKYVVNIRGTNGSGKSTLVRKLLARKGKKALRNKNGKIWAYRLRGMKHRTYVLGPYKPNTGGGCDHLCSVKINEGVKTFDFICEAIRKLNKKGNVIFEGAIISTVAGRWADLAHDLRPTKFIFAELDTPLKRCIKRVIKRRRAKGNDAEFDPAKSMTGKFRAVQSSGEMLRMGGMDVRTLPHKKGANTILRWLGEIE